MQFGIEILDLKLNVQYFGKNNYKKKLYILSWRNSKKSVKIKFFLERSLLCLCIYVFMFVFYNFFGGIFCVYASGFDIFLIFFSCFFLLSFFH